MAIITSLLNYPSSQRISLYSSVLLGIAGFQHLLLSTSKPLSFTAIPPFLHNHKPPTPTMAERGGEGKGGQRRTGESKRGGKGKGGRRRTGESKSGQRRAEEGKECRRGQGTAEEYRRGHGRERSYDATERAGEGEGDLRRGEDSKGWQRRTGEGMSRQNIWSAQITCHDRVSRYPQVAKPTEGTSPAVHLQATLLHCYPTFSPQSQATYTNHGREGRRGQGRAEEDRGEQEGRKGQGRAEEDRGEQEWAEEGRGGQGVQERARDGRGVQERAREGKGGQSRAREGRECKEGQRRAEESKGRQEWAREARDGREGKGGQERAEEGRKGQGRAEESKERYGRTHVFCSMLQSYDATERAGEGEGDLRRGEDSKGWQRRTGEGMSRQNIWSAQITCHDRVSRYPQSCETLNAAPKVNNNSTNGSFRCKYTIQAGDTYWILAQRRGTTVGAIQSLNPGVDPNRLQIGQVINVPCSGGGSPEAIDRQ
ncbi:hypothetical protein VOLCADRAFT_100511 [Volvox carteri f. nagariensis]|uniref:LysM domain-containing protein n=1 Tax=Volvox carteri f. nagariensis TaxID=3068 RepID=D8UKD1_VOLCA|nr:uncharacterized protein VOLCADRAFT_100511 [Volvox carteri f. nagariensis]EFJ39814.1 hypothetical protein VOLCADRAFT_100511 [Volvox carteri f. nagariensis]|eukprot:XP_002959115.1 hypothetical protein VOLCADRAFT_100511 [Volvox carteri f. nagariensis]